MAQDTLLPTLSNRTNKRNLVTPHLLPIAHHVIDYCTLSTIHSALWVLISYHSSPYVYHSTLKDLVLIFGINGRYNRMILVRQCIFNAAFSFSFYFQVCIKCLVVAVAQTLWHNPDSRTYTLHIESQSEVAMWRKWEALPRGSFSRPETQGTKGRERQGESEGESLLQQQGEETSCWRVHSWKGQRENIKRSTASHSQNLRYFNNLTRLEVWHSILHFSQPLQIYPITYHAHMSPKHTNFFFLCTFSHLHFFIVLDGMEKNRLVDVIIFSNSCPMRPAEIRDTSKGLQM